MNFRTGFNDGEGDVAVVGVDAVCECKDESLTNQADAVDADINVIVKRYVRTGVLPVIERPPLDGDFSDSVTDYQSALALINRADDSFMSLSADVRKRFDNDPGAFVAFCSDPANLDEMRKMGLAVPKPEEPEAPTPEAKPMA